jgi:6-phosphogluconolactonase
VKFIEFADRTKASQAAAAFLGNTLEEALTKKPQVALLVSGGSTPVECLSILSCHPLEWSRVVVSPTDERDVPVTSDASNEKMIRESLICNAADKASFVPLNKMEPRQYASRLACSLVGMGEDGHFASIFPDCANLDDLVNVDVDPACVEVVTTASELRRETVNLSLLLSGQSVLLLVFGEKKKSLLKNPQALPVSHLMAQKKVPLHVYWAS